MQLHEISIRKKAAKRVARGGKRGTTAGRGTKGQKSRSGHRIRPAIRDLISRLPKKRGFANKAKSDRPFTVNLEDLGMRVKAMSSGKNPVLVNVATLKAFNLVPMGYKGVIKILGKGDIQVAVQLEGFKVSDSVRQKVEAAGGTIK